MEESVSNLYVFDNGKQYKIGKANNVYTRFQQLKTGHPNLRIVKVFHDLPNIFQIEKDIHQELKQYNTGGEWFDCNSSNWIEAIKKVFNKYGISFKEKANEIWAVYINDIGILCETFETKEEAEKYVNKYNKKLMKDIKDEWFKYYKYSTRWDRERWDEEFESAKVECRYYSLKDYVNEYGEHGEFMYEMELIHGDNDFDVDFDLWKLRKQYEEN